MKDIEDTVLRCENCGWEADSLCITVNEFGEEVQVCPFCADDEE